MKVKKMLIFAVLILLTAGWFWRYVTLNAFYDGIYDDTRITYNAGEVVPFGDDRYEMGVSADGYYIRVDGFAVMDVPEFLESIDTSEESVFSRPDKVAVVYATLFNEDSAAPGITLNDFILHGVDNYAAVDWELLSAANPVLDEGSYGISLSPGKDCPIILPFALYKQYFGADTWHHLERYDFYLHAADFPTEKDILCRCATNIYPQKCFKRSQINFCPVSQSQVREHESTSAARFGYRRRACPTIREFISYGGYIDIQIQKPSPERTYMSTFGGRFFAFG